MTLLESLSTIEDPRRSQGKRISLEQILLMSILSYCCGITGYRGIARFCKAHNDLLVSELGLKHPVRSHVTFFSVLSELPEHQLITAFNAWADDFMEQKGPWLSADGKSLCSTVEHTHGQGQNYQAVVSLFCQKSGLIHSIATYKNKSKESEISLVEHLISEFKVKGVVFTFDALNTQKKR